MIRYKNYKKIYESGIDDLSKIEDKIKIEKEKSLELLKTGKIKPTDYDKVVIGIDSKFKPQKDAALKKSKQEEIKEQTEYNFSDINDNSGLVLIEQLEPYILRLQELGFKLDKEIKNNLDEITGYWLYKDNGKLSIRKENKEIDTVIITIKNILYDEQDESFSITEIDDLNILLKTY